MVLNKENYKGSLIAEYDFYHDIIRFKGVYINRAFQYHKQAGYCPASHKSDRCHEGNGEFLQSVCQDLAAQGKLRGEICD
jgi:hypothetical protein